MNILITSDGTLIGSAIKDADSGEDLTGLHVTEVTVSVREDGVKAQLTCRNTPVNIHAKVDKIYLQDEKARVLSDSEAASALKETGLFRLGGEQDFAEKLREEGIRLVALKP